MLGKHIIVELHGVRSELLNDPNFLKKVLISAAVKAGATVIGDIFHKFSPYGVTGVVAVKESHISIHTWPEFGYAALDIFTCRNIDPTVALDEILKELKPEYHIVIHMSRGDPYVEDLGGDGENEVPEKAKKLIVRPTIISGKENKGNRDTVR